MVSLGWNSVDKMEFDLRDGIHVRDGIRCERSNSVYEIEYVIK